MCDVQFQKNIKFLQILYTEITDIDLTELLKK